MDVYAGIGSRQTPADICKVMTHSARRLAAAGYLLRSGGAVGADKAWEAGAGRNKDILRPRDATPEAIEIARSVHPAWHLCDDYARRLHGRNAMIVLGRQLDEPVEFVGAWQDPTVARGGTRLGMAIAEKHGIKVYNLAVEKDYWDFMGLVFNGSPPEYVHVRR